MRFFVAILISLVAFTASSQTRVTVLTYNIYHGELAYERGKPNLDSVAAFINKIKPDFVACQEVDSATGRSALYYGKKTDYIKELAAKTNMHGYFGKAMDYDSGGYGEGLLSKHPLKAQVAILPNPAGGEPRSLVYTNTRLSNGQNIIFGGTHLCHEFNENRMAQVKAIDSLYRSLLFPSIVCGDFNFQSTEPPYQLMQPYWRDAYGERKNPANTYSAKNPDKRIDYVFVTKRGNWKVVNTEVFPVTYSDHMPVLITLELTINE